MASLVDLPDELLEKVKPDHRDLGSLVLVNRRFYFLFIDRLYESFDHSSSSAAESSSGRQRSFLATVITVPGLGQHVKHMVVDGLWWMGAEADILVRPPMGKLVRRHSLCHPKVHGCNPLSGKSMLSNLKNLERLTMSLPPFWNFLSGVQYASLKELTITSMKGMCIPASTVVQALSIANLKVLKIGIGGGTGSKLRKLLTMVPPRSSNIETLELDPKPRQQGYEISAMTLLAVLGKIKNLKSFTWSRECAKGCWYYPGSGGECRRIHNPVIEEALMPFQHSLEKLELQLSKNAPCRTYPPLDDVFHTLRKFTTLKSLLADYDLISVLLRPGTLIHVPHKLARRLPSCLEELKLYINLDHNCRLQVLWIWVIRSLLVARSLLPALKSIVLVQESKIGEACSRCPYNGDKSTDTGHGVLASWLKLCDECAEVGIKLRGERPYGPFGA